MTAYSDWTRQVGDQWVSALKQAEGLIERGQGAAGGVQMPKVQVPEEVSRFTESVSAHMPKPSEIVEANFELTSRLLEAQRELTLKLLAASPEVPTETKGGKAKS